MALGTAAVASAAVLAVSITGGGAQAAQGQAAQGEATGQGAGTAGRAKQAVKKDQVVTLITGDRVILEEGDSRRVRVERGEGRDGVVIRTQRIDGRLLVIPMDVSSAVTSGRLDRRLFDITGLIKAGYDDSSTKAIPLIVSYHGRSATKSVPGATITRELPVINGAAVKVAKNATGGLLDQLTGLGQLNGRNRSAGIDRVWLDGKRHTTLDQSVPQIGTPAAWKAGYTGKGVTVGSWIPGSTAGTPI